MDAGGSTRSTFRMRSRLRVGVALTAVASSGALLGDAGAEDRSAATARSLLTGPRAQLARIVTPREDKLVSGRALRVVVSLSPGTTRFRAWVDGRDLTRRFARRSARRRSALIPRRLLRRSLND